MGGGGSMDVQQFKQMRDELTDAAGLAGFVADILERALEDELSAIALEKIAEGESDMAVADILKQAAADARTSAEAGKAASAKVSSALDSAISRLSANPLALSQADADAILADLQAAKTANDDGAASDNAAAGVADTIDPDVTTGGVVGDGSGGVTEPV